MVLFFDYNSIFGFNYRETERLNRDKSKNTLESFILETRDKLEQEEYASSTTDDEKNNIQKELSGASEWLEYESDGAETKLFNDKLADLKALTRNLFDRVREHRERPEILNSLKNFINMSGVFYGSALNVSSDDQVFTEVELQTLKKSIDDTKTWMDTSVEEQKKLPKSQSPKLTVKSIVEKIGALDREVKYLLNKARITPPKKKTPEKKETEEESDKNKTTSEETTSEGTTDAKDEEKQKADDELRIEEIPTEETPETKAEQKLDESQHSTKEQLSPDRPKDQSSHSEL